MLPSARRVGVLGHATNPVFAKAMHDEVLLAGRPTGIEIQPVEMVNGPDELTKTHLPRIGERSSDAVVVQPGDQKPVTDMALKYREPTASTARVFAEIGGLMSFGADGPTSFRHGARFVQRILQGKQPKGHTDRAAHEIRSGDQSQNREGHRSHNSRSVFATGRRID
jgi:putative ABC transport system substrate-binding protein